MARGPKTRYPHHSSNSLYTLTQPDNKSNKMSKIMSLETRVSSLEAELKFLKEQMGKNGKPKRQRKPEDPNAPKSDYRKLQAACKPFWDALSKEEKNAMKPHNHLVLHGYLYNEKGKRQDTLTESDVKTAVAYLTSHKEFKSDTQKQRSGNTSLASQKKESDVDESEEEEEAEEEEEEEEEEEVKKPVKKAGRPKKAKETKEEEEKPAKKAGRPKKAKEEKDDEEETKPAKKAGRPKKTKEVKPEKKAPTLVASSDEIDAEEAEEFMHPGTSAEYRLKTSHVVLNGNFEFIGIWDAKKEEIDTGAECPPNVEKYLKTLG